MHAAGIYVHVPFCARVCPYCDFAVLTGAPQRRSDYLEAVRAEIAAAPLIAPAFDTVYFGGGTPSWLGREHLGSITRSIRDHLPLAGDTQLSIEANPEDVSTRSLADWLDLGFASISLGVQSFDSGELRFLGRTHTPEAAAASVRSARSSGFAAVSIDLIFGLPDQRLASWRRQLEAAIGLEPDHLSCYQLTVHSQTQFGLERARGRLVEAPDGRQAAMFALASEMLTAAGYEHYEVSNYARGSGQRSRHNQKYWRHVPYLGLGPGAHSFDGTDRWWNHRLLRNYVRAVAATGSAVDERERLSREDLALEAVLLGLRTRDGLDAGAVRSRTGIDLLALNAAFLTQAQDDGLLAVADGVVRPSRRGMAIADHLAAQVRVVP